MKLGHPLRDISDAPPELLARLRDELSITTAEELVGLWRSARNVLIQTFGDDTKLESLAQRALDILPPGALQNIVAAERRSYATGHDPPPKGHEKY
jgi:hypothetical protein